jgi:hypothetical protein
MDKQTKCASPAAFQTHKRHTLLHLPSPYALGGILAAILPLVQTISQAREVGNVNPSALVCDRVCECTILFTLGPETPLKSISDDCTSAKKSQPKMETNMNMEKSK